VDGERATPLGRGIAADVLRGTSAGLEFVFAERTFEASRAEIERRIAERPDFYRGSKAAAIFEGTPPDDAEVKHFLGAMASHGIDVRGFHGSSAIAELAGRVGRPYLGEPVRPAVASFERKRAARAHRAAELTEQARSLDADFAGARADIAARRARGEASVPQTAFAAPLAAAPASPAAAGPPEPATLYHRGTLRGGRALQQVGTIVVVGDVNPGAELVASGDIVVFGSLRGTAHAGAQGDRGARVVALQLAATQLRIADLIASSDAGVPKAHEPEVAFVRDGRITLAAFAAFAGGEAPA